MDAPRRDSPIAHPGQRLGPAEPLWRLSPTRTDDGRNLADFMMLIPGLGARPEAARELVRLVRSVSSGT